MIGSRGQVDDENFLELYKGQICTGQRELARAELGIVVTDPHSSIEHMLK